jgi:hypothetical protein
MLHKLRQFHASLHSIVKFFQNFPREKLINIWNVKKYGAIWQTQRENQRTVERRKCIFRWRMSNKSQNLIQDVASFRIINLIYMRQEEEKCLFSSHSPYFYTSLQPNLFKLPSFYFSFHPLNLHFLFFLIFLISSNIKSKVNKGHLHNNLLKNELPKDEDKEL